MDLHIYHHFVNDLHQDAQLTQIITNMGKLIQQVTNMASELDTLTAQVAANTTVIQSAITLINGIADRITAAGVDPVKLAALATSLKTDDDALAAAVLANTPVTPPAA